MEFQAILLAGGHGSRLSALTASQAKALLPVGNLPLAYFPLQWLCKAGFTEAIVVVGESAHKEIAGALSPLFHQRLKLNFVALPDEPDVGTAGCLRRCRDMIKSDVLLLSCDMITNVPIGQLANVFRMHDASMVATYVQQLSAGSVQPGSKSRRIATKREIFGTDPCSGRLLFSTSDSECGETMLVRSSILKRFPRIQVRSDLQDAHLYLMRRWVVDYICRDKSLESVRFQLLPRLIRKQFRSRKTIPTFDEWPPQSDDAQSHAPEASSEPKAADEMLKSCIDISPEALLARHLSLAPAWGDSAPLQRGSSMTFDAISCFAYMPDGDDAVFCYRANHIAAYFEANRQASRLLPIFLLAAESDDVEAGVEVARPPPSTSVVRSDSASTPGGRSRHQVGPDSIVGVGTQLAEKAVVKRSVVGKNCSLGEKTTLSNSVVMDGVVIGKGCTVQGCLLASSVRIDDRCEVKDCLIGAGFHLAPGLKVANEELLLDDDDSLDEL